MKIGIFDSGIGGLNVLKELIKVYPHNEYIYFGDTLNLPYGNKSKEELEKRANKIISFLKKQNVDLIIIACGTISSNIYDKIKAENIYDILTPTLRYINDNNLKNVGVLATSMTIKSNVFKNYKQVACPLFVPLIENGKIYDQEDVVQDYLTELGSVDNIVLGCTHYPMLKDIIKKYSKANIIDMGTCLTKYLNLQNNGTKKVTLYFSLIDDNLLKNINLIFKEKYDIISKIV